MPQKRYLELKLFYKTKKHMKTLYLKKKRNKAVKGYNFHTTKRGESLHTISQKYGIRLKNLYKLNKMDAEDPSPKVGTILRLR